MLTLILCTLIDLKYLKVKNAYALLVLHVAQFLNKNTCSSCLLRLFEQFLTSDVGNRQCSGYFSLFILYESNLQIF